MTLLAALAAIAGDVPVDPDADQARRWIIAELAKPAYQAAQPTWFDRVSSAFWEWLRSLDLSGAGAAQVPILLLVGVLVAGAVLAAFLIFGVPRLNRRGRDAGVLFGSDDARDAAAMRAAAASAAARGQWALAISEMFRALARGLAERTIVSATPGMTARASAREAAGSFPDFADRLARAAGDFDAVRYLGHPGTEADYRRVAELEGALRERRPESAADSARDSVLDSAPASARTRPR